jgi:hypothetical protein
MPEKEEILQVLDIKKNALPGPDGLGLNVEF